MSELPDNNRDEAHRWLANVRDDLHALDAVLADDEAPGRIACFLAHLAIEKALKAVLIDAGVAFRKIHDVVELHAMCAAWVGSRIWTPPRSATSTPGRSTVGTPTTWSTRRRLRRADSPSWPASSSAPQPRLLADAPRRSIVGSLSATLSRVRIPRPPLTCAFGVGAPELRAEDERRDWPRFGAVSRVAACSDRSNLGEPRDCVLVVPADGGLPCGRRLRGDVVRVVVETGGVVG